MSKIEEFENWAKQFIAIQDSHVRGFLGSIGDLSLHEMKCGFSERYQEEISFSYSVQVERKGAKDKIAFYHVLQKKEIVRDLHIEPKINSNSSSSNNGDNSHNNYDVEYENIYGYGNYGDGKFGFRILGFGQYGYHFIRSDFLGGWKLYGGTGYSHNSSYGHCIDGDGAGWGDHISRVYNQKTK